MSSRTPACSETDLVYGFVVGALSVAEATQFTNHMAVCAACRGELDALRPVMASFVGWPSDVLRPSASLWRRLSQRIGSEQRSNATPTKGTPSRRFEWEAVAPGISCKVLAKDLATDRISMLVRLEPGVAYPSHRHAGYEELHLLHGELMIDDRKLYPGDYYSAEPGTSDGRVWSETGCTCVLVTSMQDELR